MRSPETGKLSIALAVSPPQSCSTVATSASAFVVLRARTLVDPSARPVHETFTPRLLNGEARAMTSTIDRRTLLRAGLTGAGGLAFGAAFYERAFAAAPATPGPGPYGPLGPPDANGLSLPTGFRSRKVAQGLVPVAGTAYAWHLFTDGQATFALPDGGWVLVANSETPAVAGGGASAIEFAPDGRIRAARRILAGANLNCAGGPTPWGTWLSCEEQEAGLVWECDPQGRRPAVPRRALGTFTHEAACVDPAQRRVYLTEDRPDGCLYRFTPQAYPDLSRGLLEVALVDGRGRVTWREVPRPNPVPFVGTPTRDQVPGARRFAGGEGLRFDSGTVYFTAKGERRVYAYDTRRARLRVVYDRAQAGPQTPLREVDNITVARSGDIYVCEDGDDVLEVCVITPDRQVAAVVRLDPAVHAGLPEAGNETVGVVFSPRGDRLYFGAQRTAGVGAVYEVRGPFRT